MQTIPAILRSSTSRRSREFLALHCFLTNSLLSLDVVYVTYVVCHVFAGPTKWGDLSHAARVTCPWHSNKKMSSQLPGPAPNIFHWWIIFAWRLIRRVSRRLRAMIWAVPVFLFKTQCDYLILIHVYSDLHRFMEFLTANTTPFKSHAQRKCQQQSRSSSFHRIFLSSQHP